MPSVNIPDALGRPLRDLRISVTDRCNFRCVYCMPAEIFGRDYAFIPREELLSFEEITRLASIAVAHGVEKIRLTGGEPLLRRGIADLIAMLSALRTPDDHRVDIALTTNGAALARLAPDLRAAGLERVTVSLDSLRDETFQAMNDVRFPVQRVLDGLQAAHEAGLRPIKINTVVKRGLNDGDVVDLARHFKGSPYILRFIEYMDVGNTNGWQLDDVVPAREILARINDTFPLEPAAPNYEGETASRWRYRGGDGEIGVISSVTQSFCHSCTRARISAEGKLFTCLFASDGHDLRALMRGGCSDEDLAVVLAQLWRARTDRYSELRGTRTAGLTDVRGEDIRATGIGATDTRATKVEMSYIGG